MIDSPAVPVAGRERKEERGGGGVNMREGDRANRGGKRRSRVWEKRKEDK